MNLKSFLLDCVKVLFGMWLGTYLIPEKIINIPEYVEVIKYDSIYIINDSITEQIKIVEKQHEIKIDNIINSTDSANFCFFAEYINNYKRSIEDQ